jgi:hypothetical protein
VADTGIVFCRSRGGHRPPRVDRVATNGGAMSGSQSEPAALRRQAEDTAVLGTIEATVEPARQICPCAKRRQPFVIDGREHRAAKHDLSTCVAFPLNTVRSGDQAFPLRSQSREAFVQKVDTRARLIGRRHVHLLDACAAG